MNPQHPITLHTGKFLSFIQEAHWEYVHRVNSPGAAAIIALTNDQKLLLVEQYRIPVHARTIELPAGMIGDEPGASDETHVQAAGRELLEETGYEAARVEPLTTGPSGAGITSERVTLFRARDLCRRGQGGGVAQEDILVHEVPLQEAPAWLERKAAAGILIDCKIYAALFFLTQGKAQTI